MFSTQQRPYVENFPNIFCGTSCAFAGAVVRRGGPIERKGVFSLRLFFLQPFLMLFAPKVNKQRPIKKPCPFHKQARSFGKKKFSVSATMAWVCFRVRRTRKNESFQHAAAAVWKTFPVRKNAPFWKQKGAPMAVICAYSSILPYRGRSAPSLDRKSVV